MTYVKKINSEWQPQEHPSVKVGDVVDFPGSIQQLILEGNVVLCDEHGNEISAYEKLGVITDRELEEFKQYKENLRQEAFRKQLEGEREELLAEAKKIKEEHALTEPAPIVEDAKIEIDQKKKEWVAKMAAARAAKKVEREAK